MDDIILSALARGKPVSARRVQALCDEIARLRAANVALTNTIATLEYERDTADAYASEQTWRAEAAERQLGASARAVLGVAEEQR